MKTKNTIIAACCLAGTLFTAHAQEASLKVREVGVGFSSLSNFSLQYRWGNEHRLYRIAGTIGGSSSFGANNSRSYTDAGTFETQNYGDAKSNKPVQINTGIIFSILKLKPINEKFGVFAGPTFGLSYGYLQTTTTSKQGTSYPDSAYQYHNQGRNIRNTTTAQNISARAGLALGAYYVFSPAFRIYAEINPSVYYTYAFGRQETSSSQYFAQSVSESRNTSEIKSHNHEFGISGLSNAFASITLVYRF